MNYRLYSALCLSLALGLAFGASRQAFAEAPIPQIKVSGQAQVGLVPDMAILQLTVMREAKTAREALDANSRAMAEVIAAMKEGGVAERDLQTSDFSIQPRYVYPKPRNENPPQLVGYIVRNSLTLKVRELGDLGALLDKSVSLGVNEGGNVRFSNDDPSAAISEARSMAVKDAIARAETLADAAGLGLGEVLTLSEQTHMPRPQPYRAERAMAMSADAAAVPVMAGENSYEVLVHMSFAIDQ